MPKNTFFELNWQQLRRRCQKYQNNLQSSEKSFKLFLSWPLGSHYSQRQHVLRFEYMTLVQVIFYRMKKLVVLWAVVLAQLQSGHLWHQRSTVRSSNQHILYKNMYCSTNNYWKDETKKKRLTIQKNDLSICQTHWRHRY